MLYFSLYSYSIKILCEKQLSIFFIFAAVQKYCFTKALKNI